MKKTLRNNDVAYRLRQYIDVNDIRQKEVAIDSGLLENKISQLLHGKRKLKLEDFLIICASLGVDPANILADTFEPEAKPVKDGAERRSS